MLLNGKRPNILLLLNDEERAWRLAHSTTRLEIASHGLELRRHYTGSTACPPRTCATAVTGNALPRRGARSHGTALLRLPAAASPGDRCVPRHQRSRPVYSTLMIKMRLASRGWHTA